MAKPCDSISAAYAVYRFLRERRYESVHFNDWLGSGFYVAMARRQGSFDATVVTHLHGSSEWVRSYNLYPPTLDDLEREAIERSQIENSDLVIAPSQYLIDWYRSKGVALRRAEMVNWLLPQWLPTNDLGAAPLTTRAIGPGEISELIFFGRHERRKGFELFVKAVALLPPDQHPDLTFIGRFDRLNGEHTGAYAFRHLAHYKGSIRFLNDLGQKEAVEFISHSKNALCVLPSLIENSPCVVGECFTAGIPFLSTDVGGIPELIDPRCRASVLAEPKAPALSKMISRAVRDGVPAATSALVPARIGDRWVELIASLTRSIPSPDVGVADEQPLVSVCMTHFERPNLLRRALKALDAQDYARFEVVVVDDGSPSDATQRDLDRIERETWTHPVRIIRSDNRYLGAARNLAARKAAGEYLLFHDDDNVAEPGEIGQFVAAARAYGADVLTSLCFEFRDGPTGDLPAERRIGYFPIGIGGTFSFFRNRFGDANALVRKTTFEALGGFSEHHGVGWEDWELFLRAYLKGFRIAVVPEPLFNYRVSADGMLSTGDPVKNAERLFEALEALRPKVGSEIFRLAQREPLLRQIEEKASVLLGSIDHGELHRELMRLEPNSEEVKCKLSDLAFALGRTEDAIRLGLHSFEQRERLFHLVKLMQPGRGYRADLSVARIVQPSARADLLLLKGWQSGETGVEAIHAVRLGRRDFDVLWCGRQPRPDVKEHLGIVLDEGLGFTVLAKERSPSRPARLQKGAKWVKAGRPPGQSGDTIWMATTGRSAVVHVDTVTWCHSTAVPLDDGQVIFVDVQTSESAESFMLTPEGRVEAGQMIAQFRSRFHFGRERLGYGEPVVVVPNRVRADVIVGRAPFA